MDNLIDMRYEIDNIDAKMISLFEERMKLVNNVIKIKLKNELPILDKKREAEILKNVSLICKDNDYIKYCELFLTALMKISKTFQQDIYDKKDI